MTLWNANEYSDRVRSGYCWYSCLIWVWSVIVPHRDRKDAVHVSIASVILPVGWWRGERRLRQPRRVSFDRCQLLKVFAPDAAAQINHSWKIFWTIWFFKHPYYIWAFASCQFAKWTIHDRNTAKFALIMTLMQLYMQFMTSFTAFPCKYEGLYYRVIHFLSHRITEY